MIKNDELTELLATKNKKLTEWYQSYQANKGVALMVLIVIVNVFFLNANTFNDYYASEGFNHKIAKITFLAMFYNASFAFYFCAYLFDSKNKPIELFYRKVEKYRLSVIGISVLVLSIVSFVVNIKTQTAIFAIVMFLSYIAFMYTIIRVVSKPEKLFSPFLTTFGSVSIQLFVIIHFYYFISKWFDISSYWIYILIIYLLFSILESFLSNKKRINMIQEYGIKLIDNKKLIELYKNIYQKLEDKNKAIKILEQISSDDDYGVRLVLEEELIKANQKNYNSLKFAKILGQVFVGLFLLFFDSIMEGLIQAFTIDGIKDWLCSKFHLCTQ